MDCRRFNLSQQVGQSKYMYRAMRVVVGHPELIIFPCHYSAQLRLWIATERPAIVFHQYYSWRHFWYPPIQAPPAHTSEGGWQLDMSQCWEGILEHYIFESQSHRNWWKGKNKTRRELRSRIRPSAVYHIITPEVEDTVTMYCDLGPLVQNMDTVQWSSPKEIK